MDFRALLFHHAKNYSATALLFGLSLAAAAFFQGLNAEILVVTQIFLLVCVATALWNQYEEGWRIPLSGLTVAVLAYWVWLGVSITWSQVPYYSTFFFWWMATLPFAFSVQLFSQKNKSWWPAISTLTLCLAFTLAMAGALDFHLWGRRPEVMFLNINSYAGLLNIVLVPATAFLMMALMSQNRRRSWILGIVVFVISYVVGLTKGRGPLVALLAAMIMLGLVLYRRVPRRAMWIAFGLVLLALVVSTFFSEGGAIGRFDGASLESKQSSLWMRWLIWRGSWDMLMESPWFGTGLGTYSLLWPAHRNLSDNTAGVFAHNDYLQIWIEAGLPGLILFLLILGTVTRILIRMLKRGNHNNMLVVEAVGLYGGVFAVAVHSLVDFNFFILPTLILSGVMLARIQGLDLISNSGHVWEFHPAKWLSRFGYRTIIILISSFPILYFVTLTMAAHETRQAVKLAAEGQLGAAEQSLLRATRLNPAGDDALMTQADLYRQAMALLPSSADDKRRELFVLANGLLDQALQRNPLRLETYLVRAHLYAENPALGGPDAESRSIGAFEQALKINPRSFEARLDYAQHLIAHGDRASAKRILEAGLDYAHNMRPSLITYYLLTAKLRADAGDDRGAKALEDSIRSVLQTPIERRRFLQFGI